ncbi:MAG: type III pantothenate kinase [Bacteroidota bacterium]|nr:type III pantothenate kinase [Bacteroidota bacterium]
MVHVVVGIGNTNCRVAAVGPSGIEGSPVVFPSASADRDAFIGALQGLRQRFPKAVCVVCSVVPRLTQAAAQACRSVFSAPPLEVRPEMVSWMGLRYEPVSALGADRLCVVLGARSRYGYPSITVDFGTAVTVNVLDAAGDFAGGCILPGIELSLRALKEGTAQLPSVEVPTVAPPLPARNTHDALRTGAYWCLRFGVEGIVRELRRVLGGNAMVLFTGGGAEVFGEIPVEGIITDPYLLFFGAAEYVAHALVARRPGI